ncbi:fez family zinc finger protein erm-like isoform X2 [Frankliniella occidentalis]|uniref:Transcriptional repressor scratch 1 n=1 Tax=Frankliniella occidentalis TaxID=133901 RepID=A0A9C6U1G3_FRAOC|nr:fez family zinc finger protein erm-like isoform X2 [Frankliniella occidentalis]
MPRCYMVKKTANRYPGWGGGGGAGGGASPAATPSRPQSPAGGSVAPQSPEPPVYRPLSTVITSTTHSYLHDLMPDAESSQPETGGEQQCATEVSSDGGIPIFRMRSVEETEAAHDLLELSRSLPPLAPPGVATYQPNDPASSPRSAPTDQITLHYRYEAGHGGEDADEDADGHPDHEYTNLPSVSSSPPPSRPTIICYTPLQQQHHPAPPSPSPPLTPSYTSVQILYQPPSPAPSSCYTSPTTQPLTPPTSEYSSDAENNNPNGTSVIQQPSSQRGSIVVERSTTTRSEAAAAAQQREGGPRLDWKVEVLPVNCNVVMPKTGQPRAIYTYDALRSTDGRSKRTNKKKKVAVASDDEEDDDAPSIKKGRYVCGECGKRYATSSNLSRHKQTHRSLDSGSARQCNVCGKAYVSMPALAMHVLTHQLTHACGVCGKLFSRPWLLQGHLRSHTGEKPYGCAHCGKAFADRSNLRAHMQTHSQDKSYSCHRCHKTFALKSYLNKHLESSCSKDDDEGSDASRPISPI